MSKHDIETSIVEYSSSSYPATEFKQASCSNCESVTFNVVMNEDEGVAARICTKCGQECGIADSDDFIEEVEEVYPQVCTCENEEFEVLVGISLYANSEDVRWLYLGLKCTKCGLDGVYGDWKNEYNGFRELLDRV